MSQPFTLRSYQQQASFAGVSFFREHPSERAKRGNAIMVLPTGAGKSLVIASVAAELREPVLVFQPSKELVQQNAEKLMAFGHMPHIFSASCNSKEVGATGVTLATIGSAMNHPELFDHFRCVMVDECHAVNAKGGQYKEFFERLEHAGILGLTATPYRLASNSFGCCLRFLTRTRPRIFSRVIHVTQNAELFQDGYLAKLEYFSLPGFDRKQLRENSTGNDFTDQSVQEYFWKSNFNAKLANVVQRVAAKRKNVLVFTRFVEEAQHLANNVPGCALVSAVTPAKERAAIIANFRSGVTKVIANVGILQVGFDYPELESVIIGRPTMSLALMYQMIGRCMRPHPAKVSSWVVDLCDNIPQFGHVEDLQLVCGEKGLWHVQSRGRQLTNVYYGKNTR